MGLGYHICAAFQHLFGVAERGFGDGGAGDHAGDLFGAFLGGEQADGGLGAALLLLLLDEEVLIGERQRSAEGG